MPEVLSFLSISFSDGNAKMALKSGKKPQNIEKKKSRPTCKEAKYEREHDQEKH